MEATSRAILIELIVSQPVLADRTRSGLFDGMSRSFVKSSPSLTPIRSGDRHHSMNLYWPHRMKRGEAMGGMDVGQNSQCVRSASGFLLRRAVFMMTIE